MYKTIIGFTDDRDLFLICIVHISQSAKYYLLLLQSKQHLQGLSSEN
jgi:hypothetical protein